MSCMFYPYTQGAYIILWSKFNLIGFTNIHNDTNLEKKDGYQFTTVSQPIIPRSIYDHAGHIKEAVFAAYDVKTAGRWAM